MMIMNTRVMQTFFLALTIIGLTVHYSQANLTISTECGPVEAIKSTLFDDVWVFHGIPFGGSTAGTMRWQPPISRKQAGECWSGTFLANSPGPICPQPTYDASVVMGGEDCLSLTIWINNKTIGMKSEEKALLFNIPGGSLMDEHAEGYNLFDDLVHFHPELVAVSINYRVNAFGFLALDVLSSSSKSGTSGNYGLLDQILALTWTRENILPAFGISPQNVYLLGHSSGGTAGLLLMNSPLASGLFNGAILLSSSPLESKSLNRVSKENLPFINATRCSSVERRNEDLRACLYSLTTTEVTQAVDWDQEECNDFPDPSESLGQLPNIDNYVITRGFGDPRFGPFVNDVPSIVGNVAQELEDGVDVDLRNSTWSDFRNAVISKLSSFSRTVAEDALKSYPHTGNTSAELGTENPQQAYETMLSDQRMICGNNFIAGVLSRSYRYVMTLKPLNPVPGPSSRPRSLSHRRRSDTDYPLVNTFHMYDFLLLLNNMQHYGVATLNSHEVWFQETLRKHVSYFVLNDGTMPPDWPAYLGEANLSSCTTRRLSAVDGKNVALMNYTMIVEQSDYHEDQCTMWSTNNFDPYWIVN